MTFAEALFPISDLVFDNSIAFHPTNGMFNANSNLGNQAVIFLLFRGEFLAARFLLGLKDSDSGEGETLKTCVLIQSAALREAIPGFIRCLFITATAKFRLQGRFAGFVVNGHAPLLFQFFETAARVVAKAVLHAKFELCFEKACILVVKHSLVELLEAT